jgi:hypothetical protein
MQQVSTAYLIGGAGEHDAKQAGRVVRQFGVSLGGLHLHEGHVVRLAQPLHTEGKKTHTQEVKEIVAHCV